MAFPLRIPRPFKERHFPLGLPAPIRGKATGRRALLGNGVGGGSFHMYPDRDAPGERLFLQLQQVLPSLVHHQLPPDCKDFSEYYLKTHGA